MFLKTHLQLRIGHNAMHQLIKFSRFTGWINTKDQTYCHREGKGHSNRWYRYNCPMPEAMPISLESPMPSIIPIMPPIKLITTASIRELCNDNTISSTQRFTYPNLLVRSSYGYEHNIYNANTTNNERDSSCSTARNNVNEGTKTT